MTATVFYKQLVSLSLFVALIILGLQWVEQLGRHQILSWVSWFFFIIFCWGQFKMGSSSAKSENKNLFGQIFLIATFFKMLLSILILLVYAIANKPGDLFFVFPFFIIYTIYTVYEVYFMTKLAKQ